MLLPMTDMIESRGHVIKLEQLENFWDRDAVHGTTTNFPTLAADVAEVVSTWACHVVASERKQVNNALAPLATLPASFTR